MESASSGMHFTALDGALLGAFFISYSVLALVQITNLFNGRFLLFAGVAACTALVTAGFGFSEFDVICAESPSAILCGGTGRGLPALGMIWIYVSAAMLALFAAMRLIRALRREER